MPQFLPLSARIPLDCMKRKMSCIFCRFRFLFCVRHRGSRSPRI
nr:MAG TPA_asm: hypothetical protein [Caudoviricetes sp.]